MTKVSVIINSYNNDADALINAIKSYQIQALNSIEVEIIISTVKDDVAIKIGEELNCIVVVSDKPGIYQQLNKALKKVTGDYMCYASGNDLSLPNKLKIETSLLKGGINKHVCYSAFYKTDPKQQIKKLRAFYPYDYKKHLKGAFVSDCAMISKEMLEKYAPFQTRWKNHAFYDLWLRIAENEGNVFIYNSEPTWLYIVSADSSHVLRKKDPLKIAENEKNRNKMLSTHG